MRVACPPAFFQTVFAVLAVLAVHRADAGEAVPPKVPDEAPPVVFVPYDQIKDPLRKLDPEGRGVFLPYEKFLTLWEQAQPKPDDKLPPPPVAAALDRVTATGRITGDLAELTIEASATALAKGWSSITLPGDLALNDFKPADPRVVLERSKDGLRLHLPEPGSYRFTAAIAAAVQRDVSGRRSVVLALPPAGAARLDLVIPDRQATITANPVVASTQVAVDGGTRFLAVLGGAPRLTVSWQPPVEEVAGAALILAANDLRVIVGERSLRSELIADLTILRRPLAELRITVPEGSQVLAVEGQHLRTWEHQGDTVILRLHEPKEGRYAALVRIERLLPPLAVGESRAVTVAWPSVVGAARSSGRVALVPGEGLGLSVDQADGLAQLDPAELPKDLGRGATAAFRFLATPPPLTLTATRLRPELRVGMHQLVRLGAEEDLIALAVDLDVRKAGVFALAFTVPAAWDLVDASGLAVDDIRSGAPAVAGDGAEPGTRRIDLTLKNRLLGSAALAMRFRAPPSIPKAAAGVDRLDLRPARLLDARQSRGTLAVAAPRAWALSSLERSNLSAAEAATVRAEGALAAAARELSADEELALAFTWIDPSAKLALGAARRSRELSIRQEDLITVAAGHLRRTTAWHGEVRYAGLAALRVKVPTALDATIVFKHPGLAERAVESRADGMTVWALRFQSPLLGAFTVTAEHVQELPRLEAGKPATIALPALRALDATRSTHLAAVAREGSLEVTVTAPGQDSVGPADLPAGLQVSGLVAGFSGAEPAAPVLTILRHDLVALADASLALARYRAALGEDGVLRVQGRWLVASRGRPYLELVLPEGAVLLELAVGGQPQRPSRRPEGGGLLVRLGEAEANEVAFVYEQHLDGGGLGWRSTRTVALPRLGATAGAPAVPVERVELALQVPDDQRLAAVTGDLHLAAGTASLWATLVGAVPGAADESDADADGDAPGLTVRVPTLGIAHELRRLGDGGSVTVTLWHRRLVELGSLIAALVTALAAWLLRRSGRALAGLLLVPLVLVLGATGPWLVVWCGALAGSVLMALVLAARALNSAWRARRAAQAMNAPPLADPWLEPAPAGAPLPPATPTDDGGAKP